MNSDAEPLAKRLGWFNDFSKFRMLASFEPRPELNQILEEIFVILQCHWIHSEAP